VKLVTVVQFVFGSTYLRAEKRVRYINLDAVVSLRPPLLPHDGTLPAKRRDELNEAYTLVEMADASSFWMKGDRKEVADKLRAKWEAS
jgi:hypothetical protein